MSNPLPAIMFTHSPCIFCHSILLNPAPQTTMHRGQGWLWQRNSDNGIEDDLNALLPEPLPALGEKLQTGQSGCSPCGTCCVLHAAFKRQKARIGAAFHPTGPCLARGLARNNHNTAINV